jgi:2'-5' RNA ligase
MASDKTPYPYSCVMALCPKELDDLLKELSEAVVPDEELYSDKYTKGRPTDMHVTVLYGIREAECDERVLKALSGLDKPTYRITGFSMFDTDPSFDVIKLGVESQDLHDMNEALVEEFPDNANTFPNYVPHVTLAYVKKGLGKGILERVAGDSLDLTVPVERIEISRCDGEKHYYEV